MDLINGALIFAYAPLKNVQMNMTRKITLFAVFLSLYFINFSSSSYNQICSDRFDSVNFITRFYRFQFSKLESVNQKFAYFSLDYFFVSADEQYEICYYIRNKGG